MVDKTIWFRFLYVIRTSEIQDYLPKISLITNTLLFVHSYAFQTPEGWNVDDQYRSLGYMRPLAIWAMQWALTRPKTSRPETKPEVDEESLHRYHVGFTKVARLLKLPDEEAPKGLLQSLFDYTCKRMFL